jgi:hypothetical protein
MIINAFLVMLDTTLFQVIVHVKPAILKFNTVYSVAHSLLACSVLMGTLYLKIMAVVYLA